MKRKLITVIITLNILFLYTFQSFASNDFLDLKGEAAILMDYETGKILYSKNPYKKMYPASTTKIMTALLAYQNLDINKKITLDYDLGFVDGSSMYLLEGESFSVDQYMHAFLIKSCNDIAVLFANAISGSVQEFAKLMNQKANELGAQNTHFTNPNGLHDDEHYTCVYDMALFSKELMKYEYLRNVVKTVNYTLDETAQTPEKRYYRNTNRFLWSTRDIDYKGKAVDIKYDLIDGIKTGYTSKARNCLSSSGEQDKLRLIAVVFKSEGFEIYTDSRKLIDYGFENFKRFIIQNKNNKIGSKEFKFSKENTLNYGIKNDFTLVEKKDFLPSTLTKKIELKKDFSYPIKKGDVIGNINYYSNDELITKRELIALNDINFLITIQDILAVIMTILKYLLIIIFTLFFICLIIRFINLRRRKKNRIKRKRKKIS
ncbi:D-alanyl-D-alanine carboxypeptidase family protein [Peptostreptococcaceae bacterium AGR-M142]